MKCICGYEFKNLNDEQILEKENEGYKMANKSLNISNEETYKYHTLLKKKTIEFMKVNGALPFFPFMVEVGINLNPNYSKMQKQQIAYRCPVCGTLKIEEDFNLLEIQHSNLEMKREMAHLQKIIEMEER